MDNRIEGKLLMKLPVESGTSQRGEWKKQKFVLETIEQYPRKVCVDAWTNAIAQFEAFNEGDLLSVSINIESREFNGRWYTDLRAWRVERFQPNQAPVAAPMQQAYPQSVYPQPAQPQQPTYADPMAMQPAQSPFYADPAAPATDDLPF